MPDDQAGARAPLSLRDYLGVIWRRSWIVIVVAGIVFGVGLYRSKQQTKVYEAQGQIELVNAGNGTATAPDIDTQVGVVASQAVHDAAARKAPGIGQVSAQQAGLGNIIAVSATNTDPAQALRTVNATINAYVRYVQGQTNDQAVAAMAAIQAQVRSLQRQIDAANTPSPQPGSARAAYRDQLITEQSVLNQRLQGIQVDIAGAGPGVNVVARPTLPTSPSSPNPRTDGLLALGAGLLLGLVIAFFVEYLARFGDAPGKAHGAPQPLAVAPPPAPQPVIAAPPPLAVAPTPAPQPLAPPPQAMTAAPPDELVRRATRDVSVIGVIPRGEISANEVVSLSAPESSAAQSYRSVRSAASFLGLDRGRCFVVTSVPDRDGKTETVANLAVLLAGTGQRVVVVDCDLRKPRVHEFFGLRNEIGLTSVMSGTPLAQAVMCVPAFEHLYVLTSGPAEAADVVGSDRFREVIDSLLVGGTLLLLDAPPVLTTAETLTVAQHASVDGVILVATATTDARDGVREALDVLHGCGDQPIGVVLTSTSDHAAEPQPVRAVRPSRPRVARQPDEPSQAPTTEEVLTAELTYDDAFVTSNGDTFVGEPRRR